MGWIWPRDPKMPKSVQKDLMVIHIHPCYKLPLEMKIAIYVMGSPLLEVFKKRPECLPMGKGKISTKLLSSGWRNDPRSQRSERETGQTHTTGPWFFKCKFTRSGLQVGLQVLSSTLLPCIVKHLPVTMKAGTSSTTPLEAQMIWGEKEKRKRVFCAFEERNGEELTFPLRGELICNMRGAALAQPACDCWGNSDCPSLSQQQVY